VAPVLTSRCGCTCCTRWRRCAALALKLSENSAVLFILTPCIANRRMSIFAVLHTVARNHSCAHIASRPGGQHLTSFIFISSGSSPKCKSKFKRGCRPVRRWSVSTHSRVGVCRRGLLLSPHTHFYPWRKPWMSVISAPPSVSPYRPNPKFTTIKCLRAPSTRPWHLPLMLLYFLIVLHLINQYSHWDIKIIYPYVWNNGNIHSRFLRRSLTSACDVYF